MRVTLVAGCSMGDDKIAEIMSDELTAELVTRYILKEKKKKKPKTAKDWALALASCKTEAQKKALLSLMERIRSGSGAVAPPQEIN